MKIAVRTVGNVDVLELSGPTEVGAAAKLRERFRELLDAGRRKFVIDTTALNYLDSASIGETIACLKRARERDGALKLVADPRSKVDEILRITALDRVVEIHGDEQEAIASFS